ncbi:MAG: hypothetical protein WCS88_03650 [Patescibacteria group bacterium]|jgi:uncharacterized membrane protein
MKELNQVDKNLGPAKKFNGLRGLLILFVLPVIVGTYFVGKYFVLAGLLNMLRGNSDDGIFWAWLGYLIWGIPILIVSFVIIAILYYKMYKKNILKNKIFLAIIIFDIVLPIYLFYNKR